MMPRQLLRAKKAIYLIWIRRSSSHVLARTGRIAEGRWMDPITIGAGAILLAQAQQDQGCPATHTWMTSWLAKVFLQNALEKRGAPCDPRPPTQNGHAPAPHLGPASKDLHARSCPTDCAEALWKISIPFKAFFCFIK